MSKRTSSYSLSRYGLFVFDQVSEEQKYEGKLEQGRKRFILMRGASIFRGTKYENN